MIKGSYLKRFGGLPSVLDLHDSFKKMLRSNFDQGKYRTQLTLFPNLQFFSLELCTPEVTIDRESEGCPPLPTSLILIIFEVFFQKPRESLCPRLCSPVSKVRLSRGFLEFQLMDCKKSGSRLVSSIIDEVLNHKYHGILYHTGEGFF